MCANLRKLCTGSSVSYHRIDSFFINEGFCRSQADHSSYVKQTGEYLLVAILYVNDLIILASNVTQLKWFNLEFEKDFEMNDLGELHYCLRVEFERNREAHTINMNQKSYIEGILKCFNMEECKPVGTPFNVNSKLLKLSDEEFMNMQKRNERYSIQSWSRISHVCNDGHEGRYCICGKYGEPIHITTVHHGVGIFFVGVGVISWKYKKQPTIALSTMEAEYMTTSHCTK